MLYWGIFIFLFLLMIREIINKKIYISSFYISYIILTLLLILRKGQGTDYYNYESIYEGVKNANSIIEAIFITHGEIGFLASNYISIKLGFTFELFMMAFSFVTMIIYLPFFKNQCNKSIIPLFIFYSTFFLIYAFSAIRQGLAIAIILSYCYPAILKHNFKRFLLFLIIASIFHTATIICILMPFIYKIRIQKPILFILFIFFSIIGLLRFDLLSLVPFVKLAYQSESNSNSILALIIRIIALFPIFLISQSRYKKDTELNGLKNLLFAGFAIYCVFSFNDNVSSRLNVFYRVYEGIFIYYLINRTNLKIISKQIAVYYTIISFVIMGSNIRGFIEQGKYRNCNIFTYPYFTLFDSSTYMKEYRTNFGAMTPS